MYIYMYTCMYMHVKRLPFKKVGLLASKACFVFAKMIDDEKISLKFC